ncbi:MAG: CpXC domain-containing protein [Kofleriaceae bacterium]
MSVVGRVEVTCPSCGQSREHELVQSVNTRTHPALKARLLAGELNVLACECGRRTQLAATLLFHDPDADFYCQVVPGGEAAMAKAAELFRASGASGRQRLVPSPNALVEKVKIVDAKLEDWAIEMAKLLIVASIDPSDLDRVMLFDRADDEALHWILYDGSHPEAAKSPRSAYERLATREASRPSVRDLRIDRAWALAAVQRMISDGN